MTDYMAGPMEDWRSPNKRKLVIQKLEESFKGLSNPPANLQNPVEVEKALFEKSKNLEEYRNNFHNVILMLTRQRQAHQAQPNPMMATQRPMMNMGAGQQMMNQPNPAYQQQYNQYGGMGGGPNQAPPNPAYPPGSSIGMGGPQRPQQPPQYHPGMYTTGGNPNAGMHMTQQHQYQGMVPGYPQQGRPMPSANFNTPQMGVMGGGAGGYSSGGMPGGHYNQQMMSGQGGGIPHGAMMRQQPVMRPGPMMQGPRPGIQNPMQQSGHPPFLVDTAGVQPVTIPNPSYSQAVRPPVSSAAYTGAAASTGAAFNSHQAPSPYSMISSASPKQPAPTISGNPQLPPSSGGVNPTGPLDGGQTQHPGIPGSANPPTPRAGNLHGPVPSPAPPTPLCPASPATSGIGSPATQPAMTPEENEAYLRKLGELQKFIPLMSKWISKLSRDDNKSDQFLKLKSLHNLLQDNNKRVPLQTLMKCEVALEKMFKESADATSSAAAAGLATKNPNSLPPPSSSATASAATPIPIPEPAVPETKFPVPPQSQSLLDFKMSHSPPATYSNLAETIGPRHIPIEHLPIFDRVRAARALPYPQSLRLELPHLKKFKIEFEPKEDNTDKTTTATVSLADEDLPEVPPLIIVIPHTYPTVSPICDLSHYKKANTAFVKLVGILLTLTLAKKPRYSFSTLLNSWELCILRAMSKILNSQD